jgi:hypothetical protein
VKRNENKGEKYEKNEYQEGEVKRNKYQGGGSEKK